MRYILAALLLAGTWGCGAMAQEPPSREAQPTGQLINGVRTVEVEAFRYGFKPDPIIVNEGETVELVAHSADVTHGLQITEFSVNETLNKDEVKKIRFTADKAGTFTIYCSIYCGPGHGNMTGTLIVRKNPEGGEKDVRRLRMYPM